VRERLADVADDVRVRVAGVDRLIEEELAGAGGGEGRAQHAPGARRRERRTNAADAGRTTRAAAQKSAPRRRCDSQPGPAIAPTAKNAVGAASVAARIQAPRRSSGANGSSASPSATPGIR